MGQSWDPESAGYRVTTFEHEGDARTVYRKGEGRCVLVMTEIPGITPKVLEFCERVIDAGFSVALPQFLGEAGKPFARHYAAGSLARACVSRDFTTFIKGRTSPLVYWMRALARQLHEEHGGPGVGIVGMCLTGNFALAAMAEPCVIAPVAAQPTLPLGLSGAHRADLGVSKSDLQVIKQRASQGVPLMALRFSHDPLCPASRFETIQRELGDAAILVTLDSSPNNPHGIPRTAHGVLAHDFVDESGHPTVDALQRVLDLFRRQLAA